MRSMAMRLEDLWYLVTEDRWLKSNRAQMEKGECRRYLQWDRLYSTVLTNHDSKAFNTRPFQRKEMVVSTADAPRREIRLDRDPCYLVHSANPTSAWI